MWRAEARHAMPCPFNAHRLPFGFFFWNFNSITTLIDKMRQSTYNQSTERKTNQTEWMTTHPKMAHTKNPISKRQSKKVIITAAAAASIMFIFSVESCWPKAHLKLRQSMWFGHLTLIENTFACVASEKQKKNSNNFQINCHPIKLTWLDWQFKRHLKRIGKMVNAATS